MPIYYGPSTFFSDATPVTLSLVTSPENPNVVVATYSEQRNLIKLRLDSLSIPDPADPLKTLSEVTVDLNFPAIRSGDEGIIEIRNEPGETQLNLDEFKKNKIVSGDFQVKQPGVTILRFVYLDGIYYSSTMGEQPKSAVEVRSIELSVRVTGDDLTGGIEKDFATPNGALAWVIKNAQFTADAQTFTSDQPRDTVTIKIYAPEPDAEKQEYLDTIHLPDLPAIGIYLLGVNNSLGHQPIINATSESTQFERGLFSRRSYYVKIENIHLKNDKELVTVTRSSAVSMINCTFESTSTTQPTSFFRAQGRGILRLIGRIKLISAFNNHSTLFVAEDFSSVSLTNVDFTPTGNRNAKLSIVVEDNLIFEQIIEVKDFSRITISSFLDGVDNGIENYQAGSISSPNPTSLIGFNSRVENNSTKFP
ncbi:hypothetical protein [Coleofasciculus sp.]|uniref:hypothetical protein n=1 Tax=Coleofasciculus sp. TaxID=3100458 RepID=UPI0039FAB915